MGTYGTVPRGGAGEFCQRVKVDVTAHPSSSTSVLGLLAGDRTLAGLFFAARAGDLLGVRLFRAGDLLGVLSLVRAGDFDFALPRAGDFAFALLRAGDFDLALLRAGDFDFALPRAGDFAFALLRAGDFDFALPRAGDFDFALPRAGDLDFARARDGEEGARRAGIMYSASSKRAGGAIDRRERRLRQRWER